MKIVIIGAMQNEVDYLKQNIPLINKKKVTSLDYEYIVGDYDLDRHIEVIIGVGGVGRVKSALLIANLNYVFKLDNNDYIINIGLAGGIGSSRLEDLVIGKGCFYGDVDVRGFASKYRYGQMSGCPLVFKGDERLIDLLSKSNLNLNYGDICTTEAFVTNKDTCDNLIKKFFSDLNVLAFDMESAAYAQSAYAFGNNFLSIRYISDLIGGSSQDTDYKENENRSLKKPYKAIMWILENI